MYYDITINVVCKEENMKAIILAAGMGTRINDVIKEQPKSFIQIGNKTILEHSIDKLINHGVEEIIIGVGHLEHVFNDIKTKYNCIKTVTNEDYKTTSSMATLAKCIEECSDDAYVLEADLIYDSIGLFILKNSAYDNAMLVSGYTNSTDEVWIDADDDMNLSYLSKDKALIKNLVGELVGINKLSKKFLNLMLELYKSNINKYSVKDYETVMAEVSLNISSNKVKIIKLENYPWREIDCKEHLEMAINTIYPAIQENETNRKIRRNVLLNPGPATTTDSVKYAQCCPDICPREKKFGSLMEWISLELSDMVGGREYIETVLFGGSGTAVDEVIISSCVPRTGKLLIINNGAYGERLCKIASVYNLNYTNYKFSYYKPLDIDDVKKTLIEGQYTHLAMVYHETTTGLLNPAPEICRFCQENNIVTLIDAVSAFAAVDIDMIRDGFDFITSTSNKNIQGMAGLGFVFCNKKKLEKLKDIPMNNYYLNLYDQYINFKNTYQMRFTPPVQITYALYQAILEIKLETIEKRYERYKTCWNILKKAIDEIGLKMLVEEEYQSKLITAIVEPNHKKYSFNEFHDKALKLGFTIYPCKLSDANTFRIANIGDIYPSDMKKFVQFMKEYFSFLEDNK